jgi:arginase
VVSVLGIPLDENSSFLRGPALAPRKIMACLHSDSSNLSSEEGFDLGIPGFWRDAGDLELNAGAVAINQIEASVAAYLERGERVLCLGGDHSVSYPVVRAHSAKYGPLNVLHLDAHPDLYDNMMDNKFSHASPFARMLEGRLVKRLVQVGIRTLNPHQREQASRFGVEIIEMRDLSKLESLEFAEPLYLSLDLDVLDPAFVPGVSHHEPGGFSTRELLNILHRIKTPLIGADLVEYNPTRDLNDVTGMVAAKLCKELLVKLIHSDRQTQPSEG